MIQGENGGCGRQRWAALGAIGLALVAGCAGPSGVADNRAADGGGGPTGDLSSASARDLRPTLSPDLAPPPDLLPLVDLVAGPDLLPPRSGPGEPCNVGGDCASGKCLDTFEGNRFCVIPCQSQADCAPYLNLFCEPSDIGGGSGYCIPRSPAHCASCTQDSDCGSLTERCLKAPGDIDAACHIDCSLAGAAACPPDYSCGLVVELNVQRQLCLPNSKICLDAIGGYCDRVALPQACVRQNVSGVCTGQRACLVNARRLDRCGAMAPQYKVSCAIQDPAGCMLAVDPAALKSDRLNCGACGKACAGGQDCCGGACTRTDSIENCGGCGRRCPGATMTSDPVCAQGQCTMTCRGDNYDVDQSPQNGCEVVDAVPPGHDRGSAADRGRKPCDDGPSSDTVAAGVPSDSRAHDPMPVGFSGLVGAAPDYFTVVGTGDHVNPFLCVNDYGLTFTTKGGGNTPCYTCTIYTNKRTDSLTISGNASGSMSNGDFFNTAYDSGTRIYFKIEKTCNLPVQESVTYTLSYHL